MLGDFFTLKMSFLVGLLLIASLYVRQYLSPTGDPIDGQSFVALSMLPEVRQAQGET